MGCDIHTYVEQQEGDGTWVRAEWPDADRANYVWGPFDWRSYHLFGFLADVRNYSKVPPIADPRGLPGDVSAALREQADDIDHHSHSWLSVSELADFDYAQTFEDRRVTRGGGKRVTYREFLGEEFFRDLATLTTMNTARPTRVVFWFDS